MTPSTTLSERQPIHTRASHDEDNGVFESPQNLGVHLGFDQPLWEFEQYLTEVKDSAASPKPRTLDWLNSFSQEVCRTLHAYSESMHSSQDFSCQILLPSAGEVHLDAYMDQLTWHVRVQFFDQTSKRRAKAHQHQLQHHLRTALRAPVVLTISE